MPVNFTFYVYLDFASLLHHYCLVIVEHISIKINVSKRKYKVFVDFTVSFHKKDTTLTVCHRFFKFLQNVDDSFPERRCFLCYKTFDFIFNYFGLKYNFQNLKFASCFPKRGFSFVHDQTLILIEIFL